MKITQNNWFWLLQILGWGFLAGINTTAKLYSPTQLNSAYIIIEGIMYALCGILSTNFLRYAIKKHIPFETLFTKNILKAIGFYILSTIIFTLLLLSVIPIYKAFHNKSLNIDFDLLFTNIINSAFFILMWFLCYISIKMIWRSQQEKVENLKLQTAVKEAQLNTLKGQINPHFMFNSLNNIRGLMLEDVDKSREMLTRLSNMLRYSLTKNKTDFIKLENELEMVNNYVELAKIQLEDRLIFSSEVSEDLNQVQIPPMLIQLLVENAIKHGIEPNEDGGKVSVRISEATKNLHINVTNTGTLKTESSSTKVGIENIKKRIHLLYGDKANFSLSQVENTVVAQLKIPI